ncbi:hypothetical protein RMR16_006020 [Agrobacterium sp. rho-13.3]|jgi:hypothetical protein|uniref:hypothetical protein n=1 Tax=Agrobacterium sp. rho-13.3 TaxID=3072980 RepID=UPI002A148BBC|nr:hypothetical protein [Agrobacterium sp. rho-13.3]MDX8309417.1 hypothetical protein [Agrobacterium sp. rho-13.3]
MNPAVWILILVPLGFFGMYVWRMKRDPDEDDRHDAGQAILDFARAFPTEAIRSLHMTVDGNAVFVRLHDNKAGFMRNMGKHHACMMIDPERITVEHLETGDGFVVTFIDNPKYSGAYRFKSAGEAAEVSLWLLGSYLEAAEHVADQAAEDPVSTPSPTSST